MNLYEINFEIAKAFDEAIDPETGEILNDEALAYLDQLEMERDAKIENIACWIKNLKAEAEALKNEKQAFAERQKRAENKMESLKRYLSGSLDGQKFSTDKVAVSFRKSESVNVTDVLKLPRDLVQEVIDFKPDKAEIKKAIKAGFPIEGAELVENRNIQIK